MATHEPLWIGIDASKAELVMDDGHRTLTVANTGKDIRRWLQGLSGPARIAIEATGIFHVELLEQAFRKGHRLYVVDGFCLNRYRDSVGGRAKTDATDATLVRRYLRREIDQMRAWVPPPAAYTRLKRLLGRRAKIVQSRTALRQSLAGVPELRAASRVLLERIDRTLAQIDRLIQKTVEKAGLQDAVRRVDGIEGIGPLIATAFATTYLRGPFRTSDAFIAFIGMDVRVSDSGAKTGRRRLTKKGDPEIRRLAHVAAMAACRKGRWRDMHLANQARGLSKIQSLVIIARKLARLAFALLKSGQEYQPNLYKEAGATT